MLRGEDQFTFHIVALVAERAPQIRHYTPPENVVGISHVYLQNLDPGRPARSDVCETLKILEPYFVGVQKGTASSREFAHILRLILPYGKRYGRSAFLDSEAAFRLLIRMYERLLPGGSFLNYFWSWRSLMSGFYATLLAPLPPAKVYHAVSTGYAGVFAARARQQTGRPALVTEHGVYTNERRIELTLADWLHQGGSTGLGALEERDLADIWYATFKSYAAICYAACEHIITLCRSNQELQRRDGADPQRMSVIPNGIDVERFSRLGAAQRSRPTIALIGRVVPIKDIKTYLHACYHLCKRFPDLLALVLGGTDEDPAYFEECAALAGHLELWDNFEFRGQVRIDEYFPHLDVVVLTSLSEVQPLTILEAGAAAIPIVASDVGACREMVLGPSDEVPHLGEGGAITPIASPVATAEAVGRLLADPELRRKMGCALQTRVNTYYARPQMIASYKDIYDDLRRSDDRPLYL
jgi:glycosyltransferase involved in cell wall biosynthesis